MAEAVKADCETGHIRGIFVAELSFFFCILSQGCVT